jgi:hypothetical protein
MLSKTVVRLTSLPIALCGILPLQAFAQSTATSTSARQDHRAELDKFNAKLDELEGKIALTRSRVDLIRDAVLGEKIARSRAIIYHRNEMGASFVLERATYLLDGGVIFAKEDASGSLDAQKEFEIFNGAINPGEHEISVSMVYGGSTYGFFTYLKGYKFKVESKYKFLVADGKLTKLSVVSFAKGDITTATSDRLAVRYDLEVGPVTDTSESADPAAPEQTPATK